MPYLKILILAGAGLLILLALVALPGMRISHARVPTLPPTWTPLPTITPYPTMTPIPDGATATAWVSHYPTAVTIPTGTPTLTPVGNVDLAYGHALESYLPNDGDEWWTFQGESGDPIIIEIDGNFDSFLELYNPEGQLIASDDDSLGAYGNAGIWETLSADGTYSIRVSAYWSETGGFYTLYLNNANNQAEGRLIEYGQTVTGYIADAATGQTWTFQGEASDRISIQVINESNLTVHVQLYNSSGNLLAENRPNTITTGQSGYLEGITLPESGNYRIWVTGRGAGNIGEYSLWLTRW